MKNVPWMGLFACWVGCATAVSAPAGSAEADWAALESAGLVDFKQPEGSAGRILSGLERSIMVERRLQDLRKKGLAFYESHPTDPRRWLMVEKMLLIPPRFITAYGANYENDRDDVVVDSVAAAAWQTKLDALRAAFNAAVDVPDGLRELLATRELSRELIAFAKIPERDAPDIEVTPLLSRIAAFAANHPQSGRAAGLLQSFMDEFEPRNLSEKSAAVWRRFVDSPNRSVVELARQRLQLFDLMVHPVELSFVAVDGRTVDLGKLRGKVVLLDFWATWCGPCVAELPNVKKIYSAYHDEGFEVVGIALENSHLVPSDTAGQGAAKVEKARKHLMDFTAANSLPWPQYFDGKYWKSDLVKKYAVASIPAMLLFDQEGKLVTTSARGEALEREVKRLLKF